MIAADRLDFNPSASACAERARLLMAKHDVASDIYAALEIRWGVEARLKEYVSVTEAIPRSQRKNWEVAKLGRSLENAYQTGDKMMVFTFSAAGVSATLLYTPVTKRLRDIVEQLGRFMHAPAIGAVVDQGWHETLRDLLEEAFPLLLLACAGELTGMPLMHQATRKLQVHATLPHGDPRRAMLQSIHAQEAKHSVNIAYIDPVPGALTYYPAATEEISQ